MKLIIIFMNAPASALALMLALWSASAHALAPFDTDDSATLDVDHAQVEATLNPRGDELAAAESFALGVHQALAEQVQAGVGLELDGRTLAAPPCIDFKWRTSEATAPLGRALRVTHTPASGSADSELEALLLLSLPPGPATASWNAGVRSRHAGGLRHAAYASALVVLPTYASWLWACEIAIETTDGADAAISATTALVGPVFQDTTLSLALSPEQLQSSTPGLSAMLSLNVGVDIGFAPSNPEHSAR